MKNAFGRDVPEIRDILKNENLKQHIRRMMRHTLNHLGYDDKAASEITQMVFYYANASQTEYEKNAHYYLEKIGVTAAIPSKLEERTELILKHIKGFIEGHTVCDYGCGDGQVGRRLSQDGSLVTLADIYKRYQGSILR